MSGAAGGDRGVNRSSRSLLREAARLLAPLHRRFEYDGALEPARFEEVLGELVLVAATRREDERATLFRAPEQRHGDASVGPAADVFALAAIVRAARQSRSEPVDADLDDVLERMGAIDVASRLADAADVLRVLDGHDATEPRVRADLPERRERETLAEPPESSRAPAAHAVGDVVAGHLELLGRLGRGGMGEVWKVRNTRTTAQWALKIMDADRLAPIHRRRFLHEARAACLVDHPSVIRVVDVVDVGGGVPGILMERLVGRTLREHLELVGPLPAQEVLRLMLPVVDALRVAHARGVVHRDLKPENLFVVGEAPGSALKILDFGIAKLLDPSDDEVRTLTGHLMGTPAYMAPEQWTGAAVGPAADVWALGVILVELLTGSRPSAKAPVAAMRPSVRGLPRAFAELLAQMLAHAPVERPSIDSVHEVLSRPYVVRSSTLRPAILVGGATASVGLAWLVMTALATPGEAARGERGGFAPDDLGNGQDVAEPKQDPQPSLDAPAELEAAARSAAPSPSVRASPPSFAPGPIGRPTAARAATSATPPSDVISPPPPNVGIIEDPP